MAVSSSLTSIVDFNTTPTYTITGYGGGPGAGDEADIIIEGAGAGSRRVDNAADKGFGLTIGSTNLSAAGVHIKFWLFITQWASVTQVQIRLRDGTFSDDHNLPTTEFPDLGGWIPVWVDVSRDPEVGGSCDESAVTEIGSLIDIGDVGGNAKNFVQDEWMYGTVGLTWSGTGGSFADFRSFETTNREGNLLTVAGVMFCHSRLTIGDATATTFSDTAAVLVFPTQTLVNDTFMGITLDLQNASTSITLTNCIIRSASTTKEGDLVVTGTSGSATITGGRLGRLRTIDLTSGVTLSDAVISTCDKLNQAGATISNCVVDGATTADGEAFLISDNLGLISGCDFTFSDGHAIEVAPTGAGPFNYTLDGCVFTSYGANDTNDAALYINPATASADITINVTNGSVPTRRIAAGYTGTFTMTASKTLKVTVKDTGGTAIVGAQVAIYKDSDGSELMNEATIAGGIASEDVSIDAAESITVRVRKGSGGGTDYVPVNSPQITTATGLDIVITMAEDPINSN